MTRLLNHDQKDLIQEIVKIEADIFAEAGLNLWNLVPLIRHGRVFYIEDKGKAVGSAQYMIDWDDHKKAYLVGISIAANYQGKGYGTKLLGDSMEMLAEEGIRTVELTVAPENAAAIEVYKRKHGFEIVGHRNDEYGHGIHRLAMERVLDKG